MDYQVQRFDSPTEWFDDDNISGEERVLREVRIAGHIVRLSDGSFGVSDQLWTSQGDGCSVEFLSLRREHSESADLAGPQKDVVGTVSLAVSDVRGTFNRHDQKTKKDYEPLGVAYTPIPDGHAFGPNPCHGDVFPKLGNPGRKVLHTKGRTEALDQEVARRLWIKKHGEEA